MTSVQFALNTSRCLKIYGRIMCIISNKFYEDRSIDRGVDIADIDVSEDAADSTEKTYERGDAVDYRRSNWTRLVSLFLLFFFLFFFFFSSSSTFIFFFFFFFFFFFWWWWYCLLPLPRLLSRLLLLAMFSRVTDLDVASRQPGYEKRIVVSAGFCGAGAATPAESNRWYSLAVSRIKNRRGLRRRKFIRNAARNKWKASFDGSTMRIFLLLSFFFFFFYLVRFTFLFSFFFFRVTRRKISDFNRDRGGHLSTLFSGIGVDLMF